MIERTYTIQLRKGWLKVPKWRRAKRAISDIKTYLQKHTKANEVKLDSWINEKVWQHGGRNPPSKIMLKVSFDKEKAVAELPELSAKAKRHIEEKSKTEEHKKKKVEEKIALEESAKDKTLSKKEEFASQK